MKDSKSTYRSWQPTNDGFCVFFLQASQPSLKWASNAKSYIWYVVILEASFKPTQNMIFIGELQLSDRLDTSCSTWPRLCRSGTASQARARSVAEVGRSSPAIMATKPKSDVAGTQKILSPLRCQMSSADSRYMLKLAFVWKLHALLTKADSRYVFHILSKSPAAEESSNTCWHLQTLLWWELDHSATPSKGSQ